MKAALGGSSRRIIRSRRSRNAWLLPVFAFVSATSTCTTHGLRVDEEVEAEFKAARKERESLEDFASIDALVDGISPGDDIEQVESKLKKALGDVDVAAVKEEEKENEANEMSDEKVKTSTIGEKLNTAKN